MSEGNAGSRAGGRVGWRQRGQAARYPGKGVGGGGERMERMERKEIWGWRG